MKEGREGVVEGRKGGRKEGRPGKHKNRQARKPIRTAKEPALVFLTGLFPGYFFLIYIFLIF